MDDRLNNVGFINSSFGLQEVTRKYPREILYYCRKHLSSERANIFLNLILNKDFIQYLKDMETIFTCMGIEFISKEEYEEAVKLILTRAELIKEYDDFY